MPSTPGQTSDDATVVVSLPVTLPNPHATCPPEEDRGYHVPREERDEGRSQGATGEEDVARRPARLSNGQLPTPEAENESGEEDLDGSETAAKHIEHVVEALMRDAPSSPNATEDSKDNDMRLAQSMSAAVLSPSHHPATPSDPIDRQRIPVNTTCSFLRPGSKFEGTQQSDRQVYNVQVEIKYVDMEQSFVCGYLRIQGLTDDHPTLTTYFEGEMIGTKYTFKTAHPEWGSTEKVDMQHWWRFPPFRPLQKQAKQSNFTMRNYCQRENIFMRWKEYFLVPDHKVKTITGASFEGFYYICFNQCSGTVSGIYFHAKSEKFQQLELHHVDDRGCTGAMEFR